MGKYDNFDFSGYEWLELIVKSGGAPETLEDLQNLFAQMDPHAKKGEIKSLAIRLGIISPVVKTPLGAAKPTEEQSLNPISVRRVTEGLREHVAKEYKEMRARGEWDSYSRDDIIDFLSEGYKGTKTGVPKGKRTAIIGQIVDEYNARIEEARLARERSTFEEEISNTDDVLALSGGDTPVDGYSASSDIQLDETSNAYTDSFNLRNSSAPVAPEEPTASVPETPSAHTDDLSSRGGSASSAPEEPTTPVSKKARPRAPISAGEKNLFNDAREVHLRVRKTIEDVFAKALKYGKTHKGGAQNRALWLLAKRKRFLSNAINLIRLINHKAATPVISLNILSAALESYVKGDIEQGNRQLHAAAKYYEEEIESHGKGEYKKQSDDYVGQTFDPYGLPHARSTKISAGEKALFNDVRSMHRRVRKVIEDVFAKALKYGKTHKGESQNRARWLLSKRRRFFDKAISLADSINEKAASPVASLDMLQEAMLYYGEGDILRGNELLRDAAKLYESEIEAHDSWKYDTQSDDYEKQDLSALGPEPPESERPDPFEYTGRDEKPDTAPSPEQTEPYDNASEDEYPVTPPVEETTNIPPKPTLNWKPEKTRASKDKAKKDGLDSSRRAYTLKEIEAFKDIFHEIASFRQQESFNDNLKVPFWKIGQRKAVRRMKEDLIRKTKSRLESIASENPGVARFVQGNIQALDLFLKGKYDEGKKVFNEANKARDAEADEYNEWLDKHSQDWVNSQDLEWLKAHYKEYGITPAPGGRLEEALREENNATSSEDDLFPETEPTPRVASNKAFLNNYGTGELFSTGKLQPKPSYTTPKARDTQGERSRIAAQTLLEAVLGDNPYVSDTLVTQVGAQHGIAVRNRGWYDDTRKEADLRTTDQQHRFADAYYRTLNFLQMDPEERKRERAYMESVGAIPDHIKKPTAVESFFGVKPEMRSAEEKEQDAVLRAERVKRELEEGYDPKTGQITPGYQFSDETSKILASETFYQANRAFNTSEPFFKSDDRRRAHFRSIERIGGAAREWGARGRLFGEIYGGVGAKLIGANSAKTASMIAAGGSMGAAVATPVAAAVVAIKELIAVGKKIYHAAERSLETTWRLTPYNGRIGGARAIYKGQEFLRTRRFAEETGLERVELASAFNDLFNNTQNLRAVFAQIGIFLQTQFIKGLTAAAKVLDKIAEKLSKDAVRGGAKGAVLGALGGTFLGPLGTAVGAAAGGVIGAVSAELDTPERKKKAATSKLDKTDTKLQKVQDRLRIQGEVARRVYENGNKFDDVTDEELRKMGYEPLLAGRSKAHTSMLTERDKWEDAIAYNDLQRGQGFFQGYQGIEGEVNSSQQIQESILSVLQNSLAKQEKSLRVAEEQLKAEIEVAENTREKVDENNMMSQPMMLAFQTVAGKYAPTGNEAKGDVGNGAGWGAEPRKQYGRFASQASQENWERR